MTNTSVENATLIHHLQILKREIGIEGEAQLATIARVFRHDIDLIIEKLRRLEEYENGKAATGASKEAHTVSHRLHQPGHTTMLMRTIPD